MKRIIFLLLAMLLPGVAVTAETGEPMKESVLTFSSFDGGGPEYRITIEDREIVTYSVRSQYDYPEDPQPPGSGYTKTYTFTGLKPGPTTVTVSARSPIAENYDAVYQVTVDKDLNITLNRTVAFSKYELTRISEDGLRRYQIVMLNHEYFMSVDEGEFRRIKTETADALYRVYEEYDLYLWDGFDEALPEVDDGEGFSLNIVLSDGTHIHAKGDNAFPESYYDAADEMEEILMEAKSMSAQY